MGVFGWYSWQTNLSITAMALDVGCAVIPGSATCNRRNLLQPREMLTKSPAFLYPWGFPVISVPLLHCLYLYGECRIPPKNKTIIVTFMHFYDFFVRLIKMYSFFLHVISHTIYPSFKTRFIGFVASSILRRPRDGNNLLKLEKIPTSVGLYLGSWFI